MSKVAARIEELEGISRQRELTDDEVTEFLRLIPQHERQQRHAQERRKKLQAWLDARTRG